MSGMMWMPLPLCLGLGQGSFLASGWPRVRGPGSDLPWIRALPSPSPAAISWARSRVSGARVVSGCWRKTKLRRHSFCPMTFLAVHPGFLFLIWLSSQLQSPIQNYPLHLMWFSTVCFVTQWSTTCLFTSYVPRLRVTGPSKVFPTITSSQQLGSTPGLLVNTFIANLKELPVILKLEV